MLSDEKIKEFQEIYKKTFGKEISKKEALEKGTQLISLIKAVYKPISNEELSNFKEEREK